MIAPTIRFTGGHRGPPLLFLCEKWEDGHCATFFYGIMSIVKYCLLMSSVFPRFHFRPVGVRSAPTNDKISFRLGMVVSPL